MTLICAGLGESGVSVGECEWCGEIRPVVFSHPLLVKWRNAWERGFILRRGMGVMERLVMALVDVTVHVGGWLLIEFVIREEVGFAKGADSTANVSFVGWSNFFDVLCGASRYFLIISSTSMINLTSAGGTVSKELIVFCLELNIRRKSSRKENRERH